MEFNLTQPSNLDCVRYRHVTGACKKGETLQSFSLKSRFHRHCAYEPALLSSSSHACHHFHHMAGASYPNAAKSATHLSKACSLTWPSCSGSVTGNLLRVPHLYYTTPSSRTSGDEVERRFLRTLYCLNLSCVNFWEPTYMLSTLRMLSEM